MYLKDIFERCIWKSRNTFIEIYELDSAHFLCTPELAWQVCFKKTGVKLELLTNNDMLMMVEKGIGGGICHAIHRYSEASNKYMRNFDKSKESWYVQYLDPKYLCGWAMFQKLLVNGFKWKKMYLNLKKIL